MSEATAKRTINGLEELREIVGQEIGVSDWKEVTQEDVNAFADATGDHQWIHVDVEKAKDSPFGGTIAHGFYTVSLLPYFTYQLVDLQGVTAALNYGCDKIRFPAPLRVGSKVRMRLALGEVSDVAGGLQVGWDCTFEAEGSDKPVCVARQVTRMFA